MMTNAVIIRKKPKRMSAFNQMLASAHASPRKAGNRFQYALRMTVPVHSGVDNTAMNRDSHPQCVLKSVPGLTRRCVSRSKHLVKGAHAFRLFSDDHGIRHHGRGSRLCPVSAGQPDPVS